MFPKNNNSFFNNDYEGKKILLLVPHEDDEINVAGNFISSMSEMKAEIFVVYSTNGDYTNDVKIRVKEAVKSLRILGIKKKNIIFMGYGDSYNDCPKTHIFDAYDHAITTNAGYNMTYCAKGYYDFAFQQRGEHSKYCRKDFCRDLKDIILLINADLIICVDYDQHPDHRWLTLAFDEVMGEILRCPDNNYRPEIFKKFAYAMAFSALPDFYKINLESTKRPKQDETANYVKDIMDKSCWMWNERIRIPMSHENRINFLWNKNRLMKAIYAHKSQLLVLHAESIINGDDLYWKRRTDSVSYKAIVTASSGNSAKLNDFLYLNTTDIKDKNPSFDNYLWIPDEKDDKREIGFQWKEKQKISIIKIFGPIDKRFGINTIRIRYDDGYDEVFECNIDMNGYLKFDTGIHNVSQCIINLLERDNAKIGFSEIEFYESDSCPSFVNGFIKLLVDDNFAYHYFIEKSRKECILGLYKYNIFSSTDIRYEILTGRSRIVNNRLVIHKNDKIIKIRAFIPGTTIYDEISIEKYGFKSQLIHMVQMIEHIWIKHYKINMYILRWSSYIKTDGWIKTIKRVCNKFK